MDSRELDARLTKIEQGVAYLVEKELQYEDEENNEEEEEEVKDVKKREVEQ